MAVAYGSKQAHYASEVERLVGEGMKTHAAVAQVAEANGVTEGNVSASLYRERRKRRGETGQYQAPAELADLIRAHQASTDALIEYVRAAETRAMNAESAARAEVLADLRSKLGN